jgi:ribulose-5-phosphate 4-epimerase/fuculose-1-phosphate aldolase
MKKHNPHEENWIHAAERLLEKSMVKAGSDEAMSLRLPGEAKMLGGTFNKKLSIVDLNGAGRNEDTQPSSKSFPASHLHAAIYRARPDVGAILFSRQDWGSSLNQGTEPMPGIFDEQVRQLGRSVAPLKGVPQQISTFRGNLSSATLSQLRAGEQIFLVSGGLLILGHTVERVVFNAELVEKCAKAYLIARATGLTVKKVPLYVRIIANMRLHKDQKRSAASYAAGEIPAGFKAY